MTKYPLEALLSLRKHRVDDAVLAHAQVLSRLKQAVKDHEQALDDLNKFKSWKEEEIERRYQFIFNKTLLCKDLENFKASLAALDVEEMKYQERLEKAQAQLESVKKEEIIAKDLIKKTNQAVLKLEEHRKIFLVQDKINAERLAEAEFEDFHPRKKGFI